MPSVPKWMANAMETLFKKNYHPVVITKIETIVPELKKIRFEGDFFDMRDFKAGNIIEFRVSDTEFRHYTPSYFNKKEGVCEVIFYLNNKGIGSKWISNLKVGDKVKLLGPGGKLKYNNESKIHFVFGDETSIGLFSVFQSEAKKKNHKCFFYAEFNKIHLDWDNIYEVNLNISHNCNIEKEISDFINIYSSQKNEITFYLTGNAESIRCIRKEILKNDINKSQIKIEPYWVKGKKGL